MSDAATIVCQGCGKSYRWKPELAGRRVKCKCGAVMTMPATPPVLDPPAEDDGGFDLADLAAVERSGNPAGGHPPPPPVPAGDYGAYGVAGERAGGYGSAPPPPPPPPVPPTAYAPATQAPSGEKKSPWEFYLYGVGLLLAGIVVLVLCKMWDGQHESFMKVAQRTDGTITGEPSISKPRRSGKLDPQRWDFKFPVSYEVNGKSYSGKVEIVGKALPPNLSTNNTAGFPGQTVVVLYDPKDPAEVKAFNGAAGKSWFVGYLIGAGLMLAGVYFGFRKWPF